MVLDKFDVNEVRKYMVVKDAIYLQSFSGYKPVTISANMSKKLPSYLSRLRIPCQG